MDSRRLITIVSTLVLALFVAVYVWSPFHAVSALGQAVRAGDRDSLAVLVDFPAVRANLKDQISAQLAHQTLNKKSLEKNPLVGLALMFLPAIVNRVVDAVVTPDGIIMLLSRPMDGNHTASGEHKKKWSHSWRFIDLNHFKTEYREADDSNMVFGLLFERQGFFSWKMVRLDLPTDEIAKRIEKSGDKGPDEDNDQKAGQFTLPTVVGRCSIVTVKEVTTRLTDDGHPVPGTGSAISYSNGGGQVSYETIEAIDHSRAGDSVRLCLVSIPEDCPPGDDRGRVYTATNLRTHEQWTAPDSEHSCGGA